MAKVGRITFVKIIRNILLNISGVPSGDSYREGYLEDYLLNDFTMEILPTGENREKSCDGII